MYSVGISEQRATFVLYDIYRLVLIVVESVYCALQTETFYIKDTFNL